MAKSWLIDCRGIAKKVRNATLSSALPIKDCGAKRECPNCHNWIDNSDISYEWPGLPAGVKFDPSDLELIEHLAAKINADDVKPHVFIDEFIPTLVFDKGICYTHPKNLPGATKDGTSVHFFHKTANAYASGQRKRRKIQTELNDESVRWHKTGKTKPVFGNGIQKGCKKIMVLYRSSHKGSKPVKSNWVMHQYHLGAQEDERDGEYVVSKIFYQQDKQSEMHDNSIAENEHDLVALSHGPKTPLTHLFNPPRSESSPIDGVTDDSSVQIITEDTERAYKKTCFPQCSSQHREDANCQGPGSKEREIKPLVCLAGESQGLDCDENDIENSLLCTEIFSSCAPLDDNIACGLIDLNDDGAYSESYGIAVPNNIGLGTPLESQFDDFQFGSQDNSIFDWLDRL